MPYSEAQKRKRRRQRQYARDVLAARWQDDVIPRSQSGTDSSPRCSRRERSLLGKTVLYQCLVARNLSSEADMFPVPLSSVSQAALAHIHERAPGDSSDP